MADSDANGSGTGGGIYYVSGTVNFRNTIIANNVNRISIFPFAVFDDCSGTLNSQDHNLIRTTSSCTITGPSGNNITGQNPLLGPLRDNRGPTWTHALRAGSPAIDAGHPGGCTNDVGAILATDQRGVKRPIDGDRDGSARCDIGAYEFELQTFLPAVVK